MSTRKNTKQHASSMSKKTLDIQHMSKLVEFTRVQEDIQLLKDKIKSIETELSEFKEKQKQGYDANEDEILYMLRLRDEKDIYQKQLKETYDNDELEYFVNTAPILFQYYDIVEKGTDDQMTSNVKDNNILKFFMPTSTKKEVQEESTNTMVDRASLLEKYMWLTDDNYVKNIEHELKEKCVHCGSSYRSIMMNEGMIHCNSCDAIEYIIVDHDRPSYKDPPTEISYFSYKRINHLNEFQGPIIFRIVIEITIL